MKATLRFVVLVATPLCLVNSSLFSLEADHFLLTFINSFTVNYLITFPQAVIYVSLVKWFDHRRKVERKGDTSDTLV